MTNHRGGKTNTKDPRGHRYGKLYKKETARVVRRAIKRALHRKDDE